MANLTAQLKSETGRATLLNLATDHTLVRSSGWPVLGWAGAVEGRAGAVLGLQELSAILAGTDMALDWPALAWVPLPVPGHYSARASAVNGRLP